MGCTESKDSQQNANDVKKQSTMSSIEADETDARNQLVSEWQSELKSAVLPVHPLSEEAISKHNKGDDLWIIVNGWALDCTQWQFSHPAGPAPIMKYGGKDCTDDFNRIHSKSAKNMVDKFQVGRVVKFDYEGDAVPEEHAAPEQKSQGFTVIESESLSHNTKKIKFAAPSAIALQPGGHMSIQVPDKNCFRSYTPYLIEPTSFTLMVKEYEGGIGSSYLHSAAPGQEVLMDGPIAPYVEYGRNHKDLFLVAGGTGIAPMYSMALAAVNDKRAESITVLGCYRNKEELLLHAQVAQLKQLSSVPFNYYVMFSRDTVDQWDGADAVFKGRLDVSQLSELQVKPCESSSVFVCGPQPFNVNAEAQFLDCGVKKSAIQLM